MIYWKCEGDTDIGCWFAVRGTVYLYQPKISAQTSFYCLSHFWPPFFLSFPSTVWWLMTSLQWIVYTVTIAKTCHFPGDLCLAVGFPVELFNMLTWSLETAALSGEGRGYYHTLSSLLPNTRTDKDDSKTWCKIMIFLSKCPLWHYNHTKQRFLFSVFSLPITCIWKDQLMWKASNDPTTWIC